MRKISIIFGTRPEAIKLAPVVLALKARQDVECHVCVTAQHREMLDQVLDVFGIVPDVDLNLMQRNQTLAGLAARSIAKLEQYLARERPRLVLVQGDTSTVFCAALAAFYRRIPVGHVEAGLRTWDLNAPWPEEANRVLTSRLATIHFAPTQWSKENLLREGVRKSRVYVTGNTGIDALLLGLRKVEANPPRIPGLPDSLQPATRTNSRRDLIPRVVLITGHRRESFGEGFENICRAIAALAGRFPDVHFVYPVHLNPNVRASVNRVLGLSQSSVQSGRAGQRRLAAGQSANLHLIEPLPYLPFVALMNRATLILTDSGGIQEEAPSLGKPVLVMRDSTERPEAVEAGAAWLVGTDTFRIVQETSHLLGNQSASAAIRKRGNPYGDGRAARRVVGHCIELLRQLESSRS